MRHQLTIWKLPLCASWLQTANMHAACSLVFAYQPKLEQHGSCLEPLPFWDRHGRLCSLVCPNSRAVQGRHYSMFPEDMHFWRVN
jgi:hypothetical protein